MTPRSRFLDEIQHITDKALTMDPNTARHFSDFAFERVNQAVSGVLALVDRDYLLFEKPKSEDQPLDINLNIAGELANYFNEINS